MTRRTLDAVFNPMEKQTRFWLVSSELGETIHPGQLGALDPANPGASVQSAREAASRLLGIPQEEIEVAVTLIAWQERS
jgi:hypothetical protein